MPMKKFSIFSMSLALSVLICSCTKEPGVGEGIRFRASAYGPSGSPATKTAYGSIDNTSQTYQMLNWVEGDMVRIYSPQAGLQEDESVHFDDCVVDGVTAEGNTSVATVRSTHEHGLVWGEANPHYFYAIYPSTAVNAQSTIAAGAGNAVTVTGTIPAVQELTWTDGTDVVGAPDMNYAYMYASTTTAPNSNVDLQFSPKFTAFQFEIGTGEFSSIHVTNFTLSTNDATRPLSGMFIISGGAGSEILTCPTSGTGVSASLTVSMDATLTMGNTLILTVFALPRDLGHLSISFTGDEIGTRTLKLQDSGEIFLTFTACKKYRVYGLSFPSIDGLIATSSDTIIWDGSLEIEDADGTIITWDGQSTLLGAGTETLGWRQNQSSSGDGDSETVSWDAVNSSSGDVDPGSVVWTTENN